MKYPLFVGLSFSTLSPKNNIDKLRLTLQANNTLAQL